MYGAAIVLELTTVLSKIAFLNNYPKVKHRKLYLLDLNSPGTRS